MADFAQGQDDDDNPEFRLTVEQRQPDGSWGDAESITMDGGQVICFALALVGVDLDAYDALPAAQQEQVRRDVAEFKPPNLAPSVTLN